MRTSSYEELLAIVKRIADPEDVCHCGAGGLWQDVAQEALFGRAVMDGGEWYDAAGNRLTVDQMMEKGLA